MARVDDQQRETVFRNRDQSLRETTPAQIAEAQRLAREWEAAHPQDILSLDSLLAVPK